MGRYNKIPNSTLLAILSILSFIKVWSLRLVALRFWSLGFTFRKTFAFQMVLEGMLSFQCLHY